MEELKQKEVTVAYLQQWHATWSPLYRRVLRSAGLDARINQEFAPVNEHMDELLDELNQGDTVEFPTVVE